MTKKNENDLKLQAFPEEITEEGLKVYGETSYENQIATLSHYLHNTDFEGTHIEVQERRNELMALIREFLEHKDQLQHYTDEDIAKAAECPFQFDLFREFYEVPFPSPKHYEHTFIDLFAGIGGIRIPFDEMGYHCVFSSEWDAKACQTYFANFGTVPFGDITKISAHKIPKHDVLLAGFPCQAFSIMGKMQQALQKAASVMKEEIITDIQRKKAILMGLFIARFSKKALESFGFTTYKEAYNVFGYSVNIPPSSIKLYQQEFDRFFPNGRDGWKRPVRDYCKAVMDECKDLKFDDFHKLVNSIVLDKYVDIKDIKSNYRHAPKSRQFLANRLITGKAAEEYFVKNYPSITPFQNYLLTDTTNMGCGFDYKLSLEESNYYVEVKGINERQGSILMTEKEYNMAEDLLERYCLFVVSNFKDTPIHQLFFNPVRSGDLLFLRQERHVRQVSFQTNII